MCRSAGSTITTNLPLVTPFLANDFFGSFFLSLSAGNFNTKDVNIVKVETRRKWPTQPIAFLCA